MPSPEILRDLILSVGTHRGHRPLSPIQVARVMSELLSEGSTPLTIARLAHLEGPTMVGRFLNLLRLTDNVQLLVDWGQGPSAISFSLAQQLAAVAPAAQEDVVRAALEHRLTSKEVQQLLQVVRRSGKPAQAALESVLQLRPRVERLYLFIGAVLGQRLRAALKDMTQGDRDWLLKACLSKHHPSLGPSAGRLGADRFSLIGSSEFAARVGALQEGFELAVNRSLELEALAE